MSDVIVKTPEEMATETRKWNNQVIRISQNTIRRWGRTNELSSKSIAEQVKFKGTLITGIVLKKADEFTFRLISSAPHSFGIERGIPPEGDMNVKGKRYVSFASSSLLRQWVITKLAPRDAHKAAYFLKVGGVLVGEKGYPFGFPKGVRFMEKGFNLTAEVAPNILDQELQRLN